MMSPIETQRIMLGRMQSMELQASSERIAPSTHTGIGEDFTQVVRAINDQQNIASDMMQAVDTGVSEDVVGAMVASQKASLSFSMLMEMRNKILSGVDDVMRMSL